MHKNELAALIDRVNKLSQLTEARGATKAEAAAALRKIAALKKKILVLMPQRETPPIVSDRPWRSPSNGTGKAPEPEIQEQMIFPNYNDLQGRYRYKA